MFEFLKKFFDYNEKQLQRLRKKVEEINRLEPKVRKLKKQDFISETKKLKHSIQSGEKTLDQILPYAFALVRETARRVLGERHYDVQLMAGIALHQGKIIEQKTGEGKTLSATTALYLNALTGKGTHLVTVNDYLARRDCGWMGQVFHFLGLSTAAIISEKSFLFDPQYTNPDVQDWRLVNLRPISRKQAYQADITYGINSEFGFDYLRDNMAVYPHNLVQRGFNYAIIDEADSVLIDEARTPHIISAPYEEDTSKYYQYARLVKGLSPETDYVVDEKLKTAHLTEKGVEKIEKKLNTPNIYEKDFDTVFHIEAALKALTLFKKDRDYIVKNNEVIIVDEFTGRLLYGRRFSEGLHQAIEAKENVPIQKESRTLATISLQNYFRMYKKLAGMTGTAATEAEEFNKIYQTDVIVIPTHKPMIRKDHPDMIYKTEEGKFKAVVEEIAKQYKIGRPVLVGTTSIEKNEKLSRLLKKKGIPHQVLNAKNHEKEAQIIAQAGEKNAVTVATNMAGRGVDIILGGTPPDRFTTGLSSSEFEKRKKLWQKKHQEVVNLGGLYVIGTEKHESRRIDNQLRGRAGRQGDPGESRFYVSLEDDLMRIFGGEQISKMMTFLKFPEDQPLTHSMVTKAIEQAQIKVEGFNFDIRKNLVEFDDVLNKQREIIYSLRKKILLLPEKNQEKFKTTVLDVFNEEIKQLINRFFTVQSVDQKKALDKFIKELNLILEFKKTEISPYLKEGNLKKLSQVVRERIKKEYQRRQKQLGPEIWINIVRRIFLSTIDKYWTEHLTAIDDLREGINLRGYAQLDPLTEYKNEAFSMFESLISNINFEITRRLFKIEIEEEKIIEKQSLTPIPEDQIIFHSASGVNPFSLPTSQQKDQSSNRPQPRGQNFLTSPAGQKQAGLKITLPGQHKKKIGRNDPCPCGAINPNTGKPYKYKKCGLINAPHHKG